MSKRAVLVVVIVVIVIAIVVGLRRSASDRAPAVGSGAPAAPAEPRGGGAGPPAAPSAPGGSAAPAAGAVHDVRRLSPDERRRLGAQIAEALRQSHPAAAGGATASPDDAIIPVEDVGKPLEDGMKAAIPLLAGCYEKLGDAPREAAALMRMTSDPDLGTVIDTTGITDAAGQGLPAELDTCLRDTIDSLALPPLGKRGKVDVKYTFRFD